MADYEHQDITLWRGDDYRVIERCIILKIHNEHGVPMKRRISHCICLDKDGHLVWQDNKSTAELTIELTTGVTSDD